MNYQEYCCDNLFDVLKVLMDIREKGFCSFRGQRDHTWDLVIHERNDKLLMKKLDQFKRRCLEYEIQHKIAEHDEWRWLFFAQHYGIKSYLLDWSSNPLIGIYFAVENMISQKTDADKPGAVWALSVSKRYFKKPRELGAPVSKKHWLMVNPPPITPRLARQSGKFSFHPPGFDVPLNKINRRKGEELIKVKIQSASAGKKIREHLGIMNVHHGAIFPDVQGAAEFVNHEWPFIA